MAKDTLKPPTPATLEEENAKILADLVVDPMTTESLRIKILNKLLERKFDQNFFDLIMKEELDFGACPCCGYESHWLVPETELNQRGWVSYIKDSRVHQNTTAEICPQFQESCTKKKVTF